MDLEIDLIVSSCSNMHAPERHEVDQGRKQGEDEDEDQAQMPAARFAPEEEAVSFMRAVCPM